MNNFIIVAAVCIGSAAAFFIINQTVLSTQASPEIHIFDFRFGPVSVYENHCSRCHGKNGSMYEKTFYRFPKSELPNKIRSMMTGPAVLDPTDEEVKAMTEHHIALQQDIPFVCVINATAFPNGETKTLKGETSPDTTITIIKDQQIMDVETKKHRWTVNPPQPPFTIRVVHQDHTFEYTFLADNR